MLIILKGGIFAALLFFTSVSDIRRHIIPNVLCILIACIGLILFNPANLAGVLISLPFLIPALFRRGMGGGDVKLAAAMGLVLGIWGGIEAVIIGLIPLLPIYAGYFIVQKVCKRKYRKVVPLAPFLSIGSIAVYFMNIGGHIL